MQETAVRFAICDDDKVYAEKMKALILQTFHLPQPVECIIYLNQEQILKCYREDKIDIIFMDIMMPKLDGIAATKAIRAMERPDAVEIPIIAMTANAFEEDARKCVEAGMNAHLSKPLQMDVVVGTIAEYYKR